MNLEIEYFKVIYHYHKGENSQMLCHEELRVFDPEQERGCHWSTCIKNCSDCVFILKYFRILYE